MIYLSGTLNRITFYLDQHFAQGLVFTIVALLIALCRPYKKTYMNVMDTMLLSHMATLCYTLASTRDLNDKPAILLPMMQVMIAVPFIIISLLIVYRMTHETYKKCLHWASFATKCLMFLKMIRMRLYGNFTESQNLTLSEVTYGTIN